MDSAPIVVGPIDNSYINVFNVFYTRPFPA